MVEARPSLVLMGLRGSGKSTLGRLVAERLGVGFIDLDDVTVGLLGGGSVAEVWARHGEPGFRAAEARALRERVLGEGGACRVVALGGGTPTAPGAAGLLREAVGDGRIVLAYLRGRPATLRARLEAGGEVDRPSLTGKGTLAEIESVFAARDGLYRGLASAVVKIEGESVAALAGVLAGLAGAGPATDSGDSQ